MNKNIIFFICSICIIISFSACRKCITCVAEQTVGNLSIETPYETYCGNSADVTSYEKGLKNQVPDYVTINCVIK